MSSYISYKKNSRQKPGSTNGSFPFWYVAVVAIIGILMIATVVFSVISCKEQRKLEKERAALQRSRDSLEQHLIIIPSMPASAPPARNDADMMEAFHNLFSDFR